MRKAVAISFFGNQTKFAAAIHRSQSTVSAYGDVLPLEIALLTEKLTGGKICADFSLYPKAPESLRQQ